MFLKRRKKEVEEDEEEMRKQIKCKIQINSNGYKIQDRNANEQCALPNPKKNTQNEKVHPTSNTIFELLLCL